MRKSSNFKFLLLFLIIILILFWMMPNNKVEIIGDFFEKIIKPLAIPISAVVSAKVIIASIKKQEK